MPGPIAEEDLCGTCLERGRERIATHKELQMCEDCFNGKPFRKRESAGGATEQEREARRRYRQSEKGRRVQARYRMKNREKLREYGRKYRQSAKEQAAERKDA